MKLRRFSSAAERLERRDLLASIPVLHSFPGADHVIYLDFDGQLVTESSFNGSDFPYIHASPFDVDGIKYDEQGVPTFSADEVSRIVSIWERMAEDYRPFNVDVTTVDPSQSDPTIFRQPGRAQRVLFTSPRDNGWGGTGQRWYDGDSLGVAEHEAFFSAEDAPAWVFSTHPVGAGEIGSHEVGHALGLRHHGDSSATFLDAYRGPHGSGETRWSPIMGQGNVLTQWSRGEYPHATNNSQDDVGLLSVGLGRRPDDYAAFEALLLPDSGTEVFREGIIGAQGDTDTFTFEIAAPNTRVTILAEPWHNGPNLDIGLSLFKLPGSQIFGYGDTSVNPVDRLASSLDMELGPGTYYLSVTGRGKPATLDDPGYTNYGSLGYYQLTGTIGGASLRGDINQDGLLSAEDIDALFAFVGVDLPEDSISTADLNGDDAVDHGDVDLLIHDILRTEYGDFDLDGRVDFSDFLMLAANFGMENRGWADGDATGDSEVLFADFLLLAAAFGFENE